MSLLRQPVLLIPAAKEPLPSWQGSGPRPRRLDDVGDGALGGRVAVDPIELPSDSFQVDVVIYKTWNERAAAQVYHARLRSNALLDCRIRADGEYPVAGYCQRLSRFVARVDGVHLP